MQVAVPFIAKSGMREPGLLVSDGLWCTVASYGGLANGRVAESAEPLTTDQTTVEQTTVEQITVEALASRIEQDSAPLILDVRSPEEYAEGHIPGAVNIHFREVSNQLDAIRELAGGSEVIVYCERGVRAGIAERSLLKADFSPVLQLTGHMPAWRAAGFSIVTAE